MLLFGSLFNSKPDSRDITIQVVAIRKDTLNHTPLEIGVMILAFLITHSGVQSTPYIDPIVIGLAVAETGLIIQITGQMRAVAHPGRQSRRLMI